MTDVRVRTSDDVAVAILHAVLVFFGWIPWSRLSLEKTLKNKKDRVSLKGERSQSDEIQWMTSWIMQGMCLIFSALPEHTRRSCIYAQSRWLSPIMRTSSERSRRRGNTHWKQFRHSQARLTIVLCEETTQFCSVFICRVKKETQSLNSDIRTSLSHITTRAQRVQMNLSDHICPLMSQHLTH